MSGTPVEIRTADGVVDARTFKPAGAGPHPGAILFYDAFGGRPAIWGMAQRLAAHGYFVLVPNLFYRGGAGIQFDPLRAFAEPETRARLMGLMGAASAPAALASDVAAYLDFLDANRDVASGGKGTFGYCMGGRCAAVAAGLHPARIAAAASFHAGRVVTDAPDSPHLLAAKAKARLYFAHADHDDSMPPEAVATLEGALRGVGADFTSELYQGARHGFAVPDSDVFDERAAERHWRALTGLFAAALR